MICEIKEEKPKLNLHLGIQWQVCPDCGNELENTEGCILCRACGYSECG